MGHRDQAATGPHERVTLDNERQAPYPPRLR